MSCRRASCVIVTLAIALSTLISCAPAGGPGAEVTEAASPLPSWVRIVIPERDGRSFFVGGVSFAQAAEIGLENADADARQQVSALATRKFTELFNSGIQGSGIETSAVERLDFKGKVSQAYADRMQEIARQDSVYYRICGSEEGVSEAATGSPEGPVCQVFVLASVGLDEWDTNLMELLELEKRRRLESGEQNLVDLAEWYQRKVGETGPEGGRAPSK